MPSKPNSRYQSSLREALAHAIACAIQCATKKQTNTAPVARLSASAIQADRGLSATSCVLTRRNWLVAVCRLARRGVDSSDVGEQRGQQIERIGIRTVAQRVVGGPVPFHEQRVAAHRRRRARQRRNELALAARALAARARQLR